MSKKREDNRDIFDKALDYAVPVAAAYIGSRGALKVVKRHQREVEKHGDPRMDSNTTKAFKAGQRAGGVFWGGLAGGAAGHAINSANNPPRRKRRT